MNWLLLSESAVIAQVIEYYNNNNLAPVYEERSRGAEYYCIG